MIIPKFIIILTKRNFQDSDLMIALALFSANNFVSTNIKIDKDYLEKYRESFHLCNHFRNISPKIYFKINTSLKIRSAEGLSSKILYKVF